MDVLIRKPMSRFFRFGLVGVAGFIVDSLALLLAVWAGVGPYAGRLISWFTAATFTWLCNRGFTFSDRSPLSLGQWWRYVLVNSLGGIVNYLVYASLIANFQLFKEYLPLAVMLGSLAGMAFNFSASKYWVFQKGKALQGKALQGKALQERK